MEINLNSLQVDDSGRVSFSGLGSGIDFQAAVDNIIAARRIPVDRLEARVETNALKITAFQDLRAVLSTLQDSLSSLRGALSFDGTSSVFKAKQAFASVSRTDGATPSSASSLIGVTVTNAAQAEAHDIEVLQVARAHKIASSSFASTSSTLGFSDGDQFTLEGTTITVSATDTLLTLRDRINAANTGTNATGVSASIVSASGTSNYLVLSKATAGADITIAETTGTPLQDVGMLTAGGAPANVLQAAQTAQLYADGILDRTNTTYESARKSSGAVTLDSSGTIRFNDGTTTRDLAYTSGQSISTLASNINGDATLQGMGISASVVTEGAQVRLKIVTSGAAFTMTETGAGSVLTDLGVDNSRLLMERNTNTVSDLFSGVTLSLFQAEVGTNIHVDVEQDLSAVKSQIATFVEAYNAAKVFLNGQSAIDETTGVVSEDAVLYGSRAIADIESRLTQIVGVGTEGVATSFSVLAQIGIKLVNNAGLSDPLLADTLEIDDSVLDAALLSNPDDIRRLFTFDFSSSDPRVTLLSFDSKTAYNAAGYTLNVAFAELYQSATQTEGGTVTLTQAQTGGPASDGISAITVADGVATDIAYRYAYDSVTETLTLYNLTAGTSEAVDITAALDGVAGAGLDLGAGQTLDVSFATSEVTITLSGDEGFLRGSNISDGTLDTSAFVNMSFTGAAVTTPTSGYSRAVVDALIAAGAYDQATGLLTLSLDGSVSGQANLQTASGILFQLDGGGITSDISATDLDDGGAHTIQIYVNDGSSNVQVASLSFTQLQNAAPGGTESFTIDLGTGLFAEANTTVSSTSAMGNYLTFSDGSFEIRDVSNTLLGTVNYQTTDSLEDLRDAISAISGVTAEIISSGGTLQLSVTSDTSTPLSFTNDSSTLVSQLDILNRGTQVVSANIGGSADGANDGTVTISTGGVLTMTSLTGAEGLRVLYTGNTDASGIQLDYTVGIGSQMYFTVDDMLDETTGVLENEIEALDDQNTFTQERIDQLLARLERQRISLLDRFIAMETALSTMNSLLDQIRQTFDVLTQDR